MKYKAVLFDLDGTLLDTAKDIMAACNYTLTKYGYAPVDEQVLRKKVTAGMREMLKLGIEKDKWEEAGVETFLRDCFADYYTNHICDKTTPFDGITELLKTLHENNIVCGVITNKYYKMAKKLLSHYEFYDSLKIILGCDSVAKPKPFPDPILTALKELNIKPEEALYVGDHINDIKSANAANVDSAIAMWGYGMNECIDCNLWGATYKVYNSGDLSKLIFDKI